VKLNVPTPFASTARCYGRLPPSTLVQRTKTGSIGIRFRSGGTASRRALASSGGQCKVADVQTDPEYHYVARDVGLIRTTLAVPMLKGDELIGTITIYRLEVKPFTGNQIALMEAFADQAVIAIENARLFEAEQQRTSELAKSLENLRTAQDRLVQTEKLAWLGQLTAASAPTRSSKTRCCIRVRAPESTGRSISTPWSRRASISPITGHGQRSRAS
jgi:hypothetical protein